MIVIMDRRINDINLGASVVVGIVTIYIVWKAFNSFKGSSSLEKV
jgi:hypothetical protein